MLKETSYIAISEYELANIKKLVDELYSKSLILDKTRPGVSGQSSALALKLKEHLDGAMKCKPFGCLSVRDEQLFLPVASPDLEQGEYMLLAAKDPSSFSESVH